MKIEKVISMWRWRNLTLAGKITIFKTLAFSKMIFLSFLTNIPIQIIQKLENIQKYFLWDGKRPKVKHFTLTNSYEDGGLKDIDIQTKIKALQLSWISKLYTGSYNPWKHIPLFLYPKRLLAGHFSP